ncbi:MAG: hypothetical protein ACI4WS_01030 [Oscillospiraceae bacterium]
MIKENRNFALRSAVCVLLAAVMVGASGLLGEKEIIFPEITALTVGAIAAPKQSWRVSRVRMVLMILLCSVAGILIVRFSPLPKAANLVLAYGLCQVLYLCSGTSFAPMISAAALPVLMGTETIIYPVSAVTMTLLTALAQYLLERSGQYDREEFTPMPRPDGFCWISAAVRTAVAAAAAVPAIHFGFGLCVAPPLLVAFTEFSNPKSGARKRPLKTLLIIIGCAVSGAALRYLLCVIAGLPLTIAAALSVVVSLLIMRGAKMFIPPAGALGMLPMIIPQETLFIYPLEIAAGAGLLLPAALCFRRKEESPQ